MCYEVVKFQGQETEIGRQEREGRSVETWTHKVSKYGMVPRFSAWDTEPMSQSRL